MKTQLIPIYPIPMLLRILCSSPVAPPAFLRIALMTLQPLGKHHPYVRWFRNPIIRVTEFDSMNRRKKITREDGTRWDYGYNNKGEVTSGIRRKIATAQDIPGWSLGYDFDEIGNRKTTATNGRTSTYGANSLNQITTRTIPRAFDILGKASAGSSASVNSQAASRLDEWFSKEVSTANTGDTLVPYSVAATDATGTTTHTGENSLWQRPRYSFTTTTEI